MTDSPREETRDKMLALCRQIAVSHDLDAEIQKELYGHMEDKLTAYVSGQEAVTEDDAFILVREHFGDPAVLKGLMRETHAREAHASFARRIAAAWTATAVVTVLQGAMSILLALILTRTAKRAVLSEVPLYLLLSGVAAVGFATLLWRTLARWQNAVENGQCPWFLRWSMGRLLGVAIALLLIARLVPFPVGGQLLAFMPNTWWSFWLLYALLGLYWLSYLVQCVAWLWWCDRPPRTTRSAAYASAAWMCYWAAAAAIQQPQLILGTGVPLGVSNDPALFTTLAHGSFVDASSWCLRLPVQGLYTSVFMAGAMFVMLLVVVMLARSVYALAPRLRSAFHGIESGHPDQTA